MRSFIAITRGASQAGAWPACVDWSRRQVATRPQAVAHIVAIRGGERHGRVVAEVTADGERLVPHGRAVALKAIPPQA